MRILMIIRLLRAATASENGEGRALIGPVGASVAIFVPNNRTKKLGQVARAD